MQHHRSSGCFSKLFKIAVYFNKVFKCASCSEVPPSPLCLCAPLFQFNVGRSSEMQFGLMYLEIWGTTQPHVAFRTLEFRPYFVCSRTGTTSSPLPFQKPVFVVPWVKCLIGWWMGLVFLVSWSDFETPSPSRISSFTNVSWNSIFLNLFKSAIKSTKYSLS
jgi:hypothetical protein